MNLKKINMFKVQLSLLVIVFITFFGQATSIFAEGPLDTAPSIEARGVANGKKILFDNTHAQTAGAADWVIDGGFSDFGNALADKGYYVKELRQTTPITYSDLQNYDVFVIPEANIPYKTTEQTAMIQFIQNGGSIFFISDHYNADRNKNRWDASEAFNGYRRGAWSDPAKGMSVEEKNSAAMQDVTSSDWLGTNFGVRFRYNAIGDVVANNIVAPSQSFGITTGVQGVAMHAGSTLAILDPNKAKGIVYLPPTTAKWANAVDQGVYNGGGVEEGPYVAISKLGLGKAAFIGDSSPVEDATPKYLREENGATKKTYDGFKEQDDAKLLTNLIDWLGTQENYTSFNQVPGLTLSPQTQLLSIENPATSTEPQAEPWSAPTAGYKWWDRATFRIGSFGPDNKAPIVANPISDRVVTIGSQTSLNLATTFSDPENNPLTYSAVSSNTSVATVSISGSTLTISPLVEGTATITVTANDGLGGTKTASFIITASTASTEPGNPSSNLFFSEYIEGSSYNKALEIYNGTGSSINLANYTIQSSNTPSIIQLSGTLAAGDVFVIANPSAASAILTQADMTSSNMEFNGDDSVTLKHNGTIIDVIGNAGVNFGKDKTLVRKNTVTAGTSTYNATEWNSFVRDTFTYLGSH